jgi:hypothetical protein
MPQFKTLHWHKQETIPPKSFTCGYCGDDIASEKGWNAHFDGHSPGPQHAAIFICHRCHRPTFIDHDGKQSPGTIAGSPVADVSDQGVDSLYQEARIALGSGAYTAAVLSCRKLLMHIAVAKGAKAGDSFVSYVEYLASHNYVPPDAREWVDHIRIKGNEANHEIVIMKKGDAEDLLAFSEMLLKLIFEFPASIKRKITTIK